MKSAKLPLPGTLRVLKISIPCNPLDYIMETYIGQSINAQDIAYDCRLIQSIPSDGIDPLEFAEILLENWKKRHDGQFHDLGGRERRIKITIAPRETVNDNRLHMEKIKKYRVRK